MNAYNSVYMYMYIYIYIICISENKGLFVCLLMTSRFAGRLLAVNYCMSKGQDTLRRLLPIAAYTTLTLLLYKPFAVRYTDPLADPLTDFSQKQC